MQVITRSQSLLQVAVTHAILTYPEVQISKGHNEPDEVVGSAHLSVLGDIPSLPYICLMVKQTPRWPLTVPFGVPHATTVTRVQPYPMAVFGFGSQICLTVRDMLRKWMPIANLNAIRVKFTKNTS